ncbi:MAG: uS2 family ribosomal protein [Flavobacteriales bacterium]|nr:uS2 family ribosomal protein [Flavobacteriales bacterium]
MEAYSAVSPARTGPCICSGCGHGISPFEAHKLSMKTFAMVDTKDPNRVDFPIPSNDDASSPSLLSSTT